MGDDRAGGIVPGRNRDCDGIRLGLHRGGGGSLRGRHGDDHVRRGGGLSLTGEASTLLRHGSLVLLEQLRIRAGGAVCLHGCFDPSGVLGADGREDPLAVRVGGAAGARVPVGGKFPLQRGPLLDADPLKYRGAVGAPLVL
ncbi:hypothetical protein SQ03_05600 [Methylobacterium platani JCM 14648]|uniref:Uncharacterized protein n=2 Tax=Methylobacterium platani TaxID=427683 RepID=A0A179SH12_9HYPH|nr:hypothetical protein SQ03_05600 [Methylobacterium platani JCM 14648]OAS26300.1 hypothetical protein A5481_06185 [Methylobacterium platani]